MKGNESMDRCFVSKNAECTGMCKYCFSKWNNYVKFENPKEICDNTIIYPNCDGDMFDDYFEELIQYLKEISDRNVSVSVSTKFNIKDEQLKKLIELYEILQKRNKGIVKVSISFSCLSEIGDIEKNTAFYEERIKLVKRIRQYGLPYVTIIKPILPFIDEKEYYQIIDDTIEFSPYYLIGDLYVSPDTKFYNTYIKNKYPTELRNVLWNGENGPWNVVIDNEKKQHIIDYIISRKGLVFDTDEDVMTYLKNHIVSEVNTNE